MPRKLTKEQLLASIAATLARIVFSTIRLKVVDRSGFLTNPPPGPRIMVFWHNRITAIAVGFLRHYPGRHPAPALIHSKLAASRQASPWCSSA